MVQPEEDRSGLRTRLRRYPLAGYPVQHATTQFHLGTTLLNAGDVPAALDALAVAREVFGRVGMRLEHAKATTMLGVGLRAAGRLPEAAAAFREAAVDFSDLGQPAEEAAASYNLGLVLMDSGDRDRAHATWARAAELFLAAGRPARAAAAVRDHGASLLAAGDAAAALPLLEEAVGLAERGRDAPGLGAASNVLGLAHLAAGDPVAAVAAFRQALGAFPRSVRPAEYAMAKANLALAHEQADEPAQARLAARQALVLPSAAPPVRAQAQQLLARLPTERDDDLLIVLDAEPIERWPAVVREEVLRWVDVRPAERLAATAGYLDGLLVRPGTAYDLAQSMLHVLLELPPAAYDDMATAVVLASGGRPEQDTERVQAVMRSAMARFPIPQWQRLAATFDAAAATAGQPAAWR